MISSVTLYGLDNCDTCRKARNWLDRKKIGYAFVDYREHRIPAESLKTWAAAVGGWDKFVNRASPTWRNLPDARKAPGSAAEWTLLIREHPTLVRRPLLIGADGSAMQGFNDTLYTARFA